MINILAEDPSLQNLSIDNISTYLQHMGWKQRKYPDSRLIFFDGPKDDRGKSIVLTLPTDKSFHDSNELIARAINLLAAVERTSPPQIIQQIRVPHQDSIYVRMLLSEGITPSLDATSHIIHGLRNLVVYSACMEREPRRYFEQSFREGRQQAQHFRFGHTFQGSFGFTVESAIVDTLWYPVDESNRDGNIYLPFERRVIERIARGFLLVREAIQRKDSAIISKNYERGLNANMCNALAEMFKATDNTTIEFSIAWSSKLKPSQDIFAIDSIQLPGNVSRYLEEAAQYLEAIHKAEEGNTIEGAAQYLKAIHKAEEGNTIEATTVKGTIQGLSSDGHMNRTAQVFSEGYGKVLISIVPNSEWDKVVCDAYRDRKSISVKGTLIRKGKGAWTLAHPRDLIVE